MAQEVAEREKRKEQVPVQKSEGMRRGELDRLIDPFDQLMADWWRRPFPSLMPSFPGFLRPSRNVGESLGLRVPAVDVYEEAEEVVLKAEIPGLSKDDLKIELSDSTLTLSGEKKKEEDVKEEDYSYSERSYGTFSRTLPLPCAVKIDTAKATFKKRCFGSEAAED